MFGSEASIVWLRLLSQLWGFLDKSQPLRRPSRRPCVRARALCLSFERRIAHVWPDKRHLLEVKGQADCSPDPDPTSFARTRIPSSCGRPPYGSRNPTATASPLSSNVFDPEHSCDKFNCESAARRTQFRRITACKHMKNVFLLHNAKASCPNAWFSQKAQSRRMLLRHAHL